MKQLKIIIITGLSGSGKSTAMAAFEDAGFYCVDNMPVVLLPKFLELPLESDSEIAGLVFVMDLREKSFLPHYSSIFEFLQKKGHNFTILFLEAEEEILLKRYSQTRRHHPLARGKSLLDGIRIEKKRLKDIKMIANKIINTSHYNVHDLKSVIIDITQKSKSSGPMRINILSFGFKFGIPQDADLIMDVRFLVNPYFIPELKDLDGKDGRIKRYVLDNEETVIFMEKYFDLLDYLVPLYKKEGKAYLTIAIGCTGGKHRSVCIAQYLYEHLKQLDKKVIITHRDIDL